MPIQHYILACFLLPPEKKFHHASTHGYQLIVTFAKAPLTHIFPYHLHTLKQNSSFFCIHLHSSNTFSVVSRIFLGNTQWQSCRLNHYAITLKIPGTTAP